MTIRTLITASALALAVSVSTSALAANQCGGDIHFAKGKSSTQLSGAVAGNDVCQYTFYAKRGQELIVTMGKNDHPQAFLYGDVSKILADNQPFILPKDGKYELRIGMTRNDARKYPNKAQPFTAQFSITAPQKTDSRVVRAASSGFAGAYEGVLPCITCKGVDTYLTLYDDGSYTLSEKYLGRGDDASYSQQGAWTVYGNAIILEPENGSDNLYLIAQNGDVYFVSREEAGAAQPKVNPQHRLKHQP